MWTEGFPGCGAGGGRDAAEASLLPLPWEEPGSLCSTRSLILCLSCFKISSLKEAVKDDRPQIHVILLICNSKAKRLCPSLLTRTRTAVITQPPWPEETRSLGRTAHLKGSETIPMTRGVSRQPSHSIQGAMWGSCPLDRPRCHHYDVASLTADLGKGPATVGLSQSSLLDFRFTLKNGPSGPSE